MDWIRGFRRLGWVIIILVAPVLAFYSYQLSKEQVGYSRHLVTPSKYAAEYKAVDIPEVGILYFPKHWTDEEVSSEVREAYKQFKDRSNPDQPMELQRSPIKEVSVVKFVGYILLSIGLLTVLVQGSILVVAWVGRGFQGRE